MYAWQVLEIYLSCVFFLFIMLALLQSQADTFSYILCVTLCSLFDEWRLKPDVTELVSWRRSRFIVWLHAIPTRKRCLTELHWNWVWTKQFCSLWATKKSTWFAFSGLSIDFSIISYLFVAFKYNFTVLDGINFDTFSICVTLCLLFCT